MTKRHTLIRVFNARIMTLKCNPFIYPARTCIFLDYFFLTIVNFYVERPIRVLNYFRILRKICMATISNLGIGSAGLGDLYNQLDAAERTKLTTITSQQSTYNAQLSAYGKLQSAMTSLQTATAALGKATTWNSTSVSSTTRPLPPRQRLTRPWVPLLSTSTRLQGAGTDYRLLCKQHGSAGRYDRYDA